MGLAYVWHASIIVEAVFPMEVVASSGENHEINSLLCIYYLSGKSCCAQIALPTHTSVDGVNARSN